MGPVGLEPGPYGVLLFNAQRLDQRLRTQTAAEMERFFPSLGDVRRCEKRLF